MVVENNDNELTKSASPLGFDHIKFRVGNAKQAAFWYCANFGFKPYAFRGLETGSTTIATHVVKQGQVVLAFEAPIEPNNDEFGNHHQIHGDSIYDVAFEIDDVTTLMKHAQAKGAHVVQNVTEETDKHGTIRYASLQTFGDVIHTLIERKNYDGFFMPGFRPHPWTGKNFKRLPMTNFLQIDHFVAAQPETEMASAAEWYERNLHFHRFWTGSSNDSYVNTPKSALSVQFKANDNSAIKVLIAEGLQEPGKGTSQIQEFVDYNGGAGVQHVAFSTDDIVSTVRALKERGVDLLEVPDAYYDLVRERLKDCKIKIEEDLALIQELGLFIDFDENGYLLQKFSKPVDDRPTLFIEIIQRSNFKGFGAGNFKAVFEAVERLQEERKTLFAE